MNERGRKTGVTPRFTTDDQVVRITPDLVQVGYLLHDGMVLDVEVRYSQSTGQPIEWWFETLHAVIHAGPDDEIYVYARVAPEIAADLRTKYEEMRRIRP